MDKKLVRLTLALVVGCSSVIWSPAQEDAAPATKKPVSKATKDLQETKAKARDKRLAAKAKAEGEAKAKALDLNRATLDELKKLPGMTDAYAAAIIAKRPYHSKAELVTKNAIPAGVYQSLRKQVAIK